MRTFTPQDGIGAPPPIAPPGPDVAEGPMRRELLRQICRLEIETSRFRAANGLGQEEPVPARRGPAILSTAQLEEIRDELLSVRTALHEAVVARMSAPEPAAGPVWRRRRAGA